MSLPPGLPYAPSHCTKLFDQESTSTRWSAIAVTVQALLKAFDNTILEASHRTLKLKRTPDPKGVRWWNNAYSVAHTLTRSATAGEARQAASLNLKHMITKAKQDWAHDCLHEVVDVTDIWAVVNHRKGRQTTLFPPLRDTNGSAIDTPDGKALVFRDKFFPGNPMPVPLHHPSDLYPGNHGHGCQSPPMRSPRHST
jgi:hypothetical protein